MRIAQFANEAVAFHLHKKRDFFRRLEGTKDPLKEQKEQDKLIEKIRERLENHKYQVERDRVLSLSKDKKSWKNQIGSEAYQSESKA